MKKYCILIVLLVLATTSCKKTQQSASGVAADTTQIVKKLDSISVTFFNYIDEEAAPIHCDNFPSAENQSAKLNRTVVYCNLTNSTLINKIEDRIDNLHPADNLESINNIRLKATLHYNNGNKLQICLGGIYANQIYVDGLAQQKDNQLIFMLKNNAGYYPWMIGDAMMQMTELKDNSFAKEPFRSSSEYQAYQEALQKAQ